MPAASLHPVTLKINPKRHQSPALARVASLEQRLHAVAVEVALGAVGHEEGSVGGAQITACLHGCKHVAVADAALASEGEDAPGVVVGRLVVEEVEGARVLSWFAWCGAGVGGEAVRLLLAVDELRCGVVGAAPRCICCSISAASAVWLRRTSRKKVGMNTASKVTESEMAKAVHTSE